MSVSSFLNLRKILLSAFISLVVLLPGNIFCKAAVSNNLPKESFKTLPMAQEKSVSTYVPSEACKDGGIAVTINYAAMPRYKEKGMPVAVVIPGYMQASGLRFTMHAAQQGFVEVRFAFPGGGLKKFHSGGSWDLRGVDSQKALRDVILFAGGKSRDFKGRSLADLVESTVNYDNLGLVGWHDGFNIAVITMVKYHENLSFIKWLASYESPVGALMLPSNLGTVKELNLNNHYRQGSSATGKIVIDYSKLAWQPDIFRNRTRRLKKKLATPKGVLFFDENENRLFDELSEFALNYAILPGYPRQIYAPELTSAMEHKEIFVRRVNVDDLSDEGFEELKEKHPEVIEILGSAKKPPKSTKKGDDKNVIEVEMWPETVARLNQSEAFYKERDASSYINRLAELYPHLLVTIFASRIDHFEQQVDHPHVALLYNLFLTSKLKWVRLNPERVYVGFTADMNLENFVSNKVRETIDASNIKSHLEPEGLIKDDAYMRAVICELADRVKNKDFSYPLEGVLESYMNEALLKRQMELNAKSGEKEE